MRDSYGYECGECGYIPSAYELQQGFCPTCFGRAERRRKQQEHEEKVEAANKGTYREPADAARTSSKP